MGAKRYAAADGGSTGTPCKSAAETPRVTCRQQASVELQSWDRQTDRQTDASQHRLMPPTVGGA